MARLRVLALAGFVLLAFAAERLDAQDAPPAPTPPPATPRPPMAPTPPTQRRVAFGFMVDPGPPLTVKQVMPGSPAARAGIREGDVLISVDGRPATIASIRQAGRRVAPDREVEFRIRRAGREELVTVVPGGSLTVVTPKPHRSRVVVIDPDSVEALVELYLDDARETLELHGLEDMKIELDLDNELLELHDFDWDSLGKALEGLGPAMEEMTREMEGMSFDLDASEFGANFEMFGFLPGARLTRLEPDLAGYFPGAERGALVLSVRPGSPAAQAGLEAGDVIVQVDGEPVEDPGDLRRPLRTGETHELAIVRHGQRRMITFSR